MANFQFSQNALNLAYISLASFEAQKMLDISGQRFLANAEGTRYTAYLDSVGIWTIGRGITRYEDGTYVKKGDRINAQREIALFNNTVKKYVDNVNRVVKSNINQNQFNSLVSFSYNIGITAFNNSTLLKKVNKNPNDKTIRESFMSWKYGTIKGVKTVVPGLLNRRTSEANLYFSK